MIIAIRLHDLEIIKHLIKKGADVNLQGKYGKTALKEACSYDYLEIVKFLVEKGADINFSDDDNDTALRTAIRAGHPQVVNFLLDAGATIDLQDRRNCEYILESLDLEIIRTFVQKGLDINLSFGFQEGYTCLMRACLDPSKNNLIKFLLDKGADVNTQNECGKTALMLHVGDNGCSSIIVKLLIGAGANLDLQIDARNYEYLQDYDGYTALMFALKFDRIGATEILVKNGANIHLKNKKGKTALDIAQEKNDIEMVKLLKSKYSE